MPYYQTTITQSGGGLNYGVPDVQKISGPRYRWPMNECAFSYPDTVTGLTELTEAEYTAFDAITWASADGKVTADGSDTEALTVTYPVTGGEAILSVNDEEVSRQTIDEDGVATFTVSADSSLAGTLLKCQMSHWDSTSGSSQWKPQVLYIEAEASA